MNEGNSTFENPPPQGLFIKAMRTYTSRCDKNMMDLAEMLCVILINAIFSETGKMAELLLLFKSRLPVADSRPPVPMEADFD